LEAAPDAIIAVDREGAIQLVNTQAERMFGYPRAGLIGQPIERLLPERLREAHLRHRTAYMASPQTRPMGAGLDLIGRREDGSEFPVEISLSPLETETGLLIISIIRDITDRKRLEAQLRQYTVDLERLVEARTAELRAAQDFSETVIETANSLIVVRAPDGTILLFNRRCEEITGYASEEVIGRNWFALLTPADARAKIQAYFTAFIEGRPPDTWEGPLITKAGHGRLIQWRNSVTRDREGRATNVISVGLDVTDQRRLEEQMLHAERLAAIGRMAAQAAHEIRNPFNSIALNVELLADEIREHTWADSEEAAELIQVILSEMERLNGVIRDYLQFSRRPVKQVYTESMNRLLDDIVRLVHSEIRQARIDLVRTLDEYLPPVIIDRSLINQALLNCIRNAMEAMPDGGTLTIASRFADGRVEVLITDTGVGIPAEDLEKVFDPFYSTKTKGTGLGLPYVRQIVMEHGGHVDLRSRPGEGTTVTIQLPAHLTIEGV
jgi:PAS domain S-box-containing protein